MKKIKDANICCYPMDLRSACSLFRFIAPIKVAENQGLIKQVDLFNSVDLRLMVDYDIVMVGREVNYSYLQDIKYLKEHGVCVILDSDDMLQSVAVNNPAYKMYNPKSAAVEHYFEACKIANGMTTTTYELAQDLKYRNPNVHIVNNYIDYSLRPWQSKINDNPDKIYIGWAGSISHLDDLLLIKPAIVEILNKYPQVSFVFYGAANLFEVFNSDHSLTQDRVVHIPPEPLHTYVKNLPIIDIGLCPLMDSPFNRAKSALKPLEYGAAGIPAICSAVAPYVRYIDQGVNGFLAKNHSDWVKYLSIIIEDFELYKQMAVAANIKAHAFALEDNISEFLTAWENIWNGVQQEYVSSIWNQNVIKMGRNDSCPCGSGHKIKKCCQKYLI